jgi:hypothetical protein
LLRSSLEDRLIDAWVSLEALLLGVREGELSFRAAIRLAEVLAENGAERIAIYRFTRAAYAWRSAIVHGSSPSKNDVRGLTLQEATDTTREYLRTALLKVLELQVRFDPQRLEVDLLGRDAASIPSV